MWQANKQTIIFLGGAVVIFLILSLGAGFLYRSIKTESALVKSAETAIATLEDKERDLNNAKSSLEVFKKDIDVVDGAFLAEESFVTFFKLLEKIADMSGVIFQADRADLPNSPTGRAELNFTVKGSYAGITNFFSLFDQIPYAGIVDQVSIAPDGTAKGTLFARAHYIIFNFLPTR